jgi:hypothetical protein
VDYPEPLAFALLALAAYRIWRLLAADTILNGPRHWVLGLGYRWADGDPIPKKYREHWSIFLECPWCLGFWVSGAVLGIYCAVAGWIGLLGFFVTWLALSAIVGLVRGNLDAPEEE